MAEYNYSGKFNPPAPVLELSISAPLSTESASSLGLVDSGADITVLPEQVISQLKIRRVDFALVSGFGKDIVEVPVYSATLNMRGILKPQIYRVLSWDEDYTLIGRDLLNKLVAILNGPQAKLNLKLPK